MYIGTDPGINNIAFAHVGKKGEILGGEILIANQSLSQLDRLILNTAEYQKIVPKCKYAAIEYTMARSCPSITSLSLLALCSGILSEIHRECRGCKVLLVGPSTWQTKKGKEENADYLKTTLSEKQVDEIYALADKYPRSIRHNLVDAFGIAFWLKEVVEGLDATK